MTTQPSNPLTPSAPLRLDVRILTAKAVRECYSIATRGQPNKKREAPPHQVAEVIALLIAALDDTRSAIVRDGKLPA